MRALITECKTARLQDMTGEKIAGECKPIGYIASNGFAVAFAQEGRKPQHLVGPELAGSAGDSPAGFWRHKNQVAGSAGYDTALEIEAEPEFGQKLQFEADNQRCSKNRIVEIAENFVECLVESG